jgi:D-aminoacyl-tRNA deacylase
LILLVASKKDDAGINIAKALVEEYKFEELAETYQNSPIYLKKLLHKELKLLFLNNEIIDTQFLGDIFDPELLIFLSKHSSSMRLPTLSVHTPGNLADAKFGGIPKTVSISPAVAMKNALLRLSELTTRTGIDYKVSYECTHHGPSLDIPSLFVELGSSLIQWNDMKAARVVARAAISAISEAHSYSVVLGIGGPHYNSKFTNMALTSSMAFGHIIPKYAIGSIDIEMIKHCIEKTLGLVEYVVLDWKGIKGEHKSKIISALDLLNIPFKKI